jgi:hypothetical protein
LKTPFFFAVGTIGLSRRGGRKAATLMAAAGHNLEEDKRKRGHIDSTRTHLNEVIVGPATATGVVDVARALFERAGVDVNKLRKDYCQAVELVFSLPQGTDVDVALYFRRCTDWATDRFGADAILSAVIHHDEPAPHAHILVSPVVSGKVKGSVLVSRTALASLRKSFEVLVARPFGLRRPPARLQGPARADAARSVLECLEQTHDPAMKSRLWQPLRQAIEADPRPFALSLGMDLAEPTPRRTRTMTQVFTSVGRGPRVELKTTGHRNP